MDLITLKQSFLQILTEGEMREIGNLKFDVPWLALKMQEAT